MERRSKSIEELLEDVKHSLDTYYTGIVAVNKDVKQALENLKTIREEAKEEFSKAIQDKLIPELLKLEKTTKELNSLLSDIRLSCKGGVLEATQELREEARALEKLLDNTKHDFKDFNISLKKSLDDFNKSLDKQLKNFLDNFTKTLEKQKLEVQEYADLVSKRVKESERRVMLNLNLGAILLGFALGVLSQWIVPFLWQLILYLLKAKGG